MKNTKWNPIFPALNLLASILFLIVAIAQTGMPPNAWYGAVVLCQLISGAGVLSAYAENKEQEKDRNV